MSNSIRLTWKGHSCFRLEKDGYMILFDPYQDGAVPGYAPLREEADLVICSHGHRDHGAAELIGIRKASALNPFTVETVECPHDEAGGTLRGMNRISILESDGLRIAHFGDIGCPLTEEQLKQVGKLTVAMIPVGGFFTMEPEGIQRLLERLQPKIVIPMHYRDGGLGYEKIGTLDAFVKYREDVKYLHSNTLLCDSDTPAMTAVFAYEG